MNINQIALNATKAEFKLVGVNEFNAKVVLARGSFDDCTGIAKSTKPEQKARVVRNELFGLTAQQAKEVLFNR